MMFQGFLKEVLYIHEMLRSLEIRIFVLIHSLTPLDPQIAIALVKVVPNQFHYRWVMYEDIHSL